MDSVTLVIEIGIAVLLTAIVISVIYLYFRDASRDMQQASEEIIATTNRFDLVTLKQYDNAEVNGYDVRYAIKHYGTSNSTIYKESWLPSDWKIPTDFFVCVKFKSTESSDVKRLDRKTHVTFMIPNSYETLDNSTVYTSTDGKTQFIKASYIAAEAKFMSYLLIRNWSDNAETNEELKHFRLERVSGYDVSSEDIVGIYFEEI